MTYDFELTLIKQTYIEDEIGNQTPTEIKTVVYCGLKSIGRTDKEQMEIVKVAMGF